MNTQDSDWPRLLAWFERAADATPAERQRLLDELGSDDPALRSRVQRLLALDASDSDLGADVVGWRERLIEASEEFVPARIGAWRIVRELGQGGMGRVFLAERADGEYEQQVALKLIRGEFTSDTAVARFLAERRILARLDHPGIASLVDGGVDADGRPWFAMQYVEGIALPDHCTRHALGLEARLKLVVAVCEAVAYAHRQLVVHCDLKPSNVLVDIHGQPRLLDFGIARLLEPRGGERQITQTQARALTPGYAAPEQLAGQPVSVATDVYALGTLLYELLAGVRPYAHDDGTAAAIAVAQARGEPRPLSWHAGATGPVPARHLRGDLDLIAATALRHDPAQRYPDAAALAEDLRRHLAGWPLRAQRDSAVHRTRKFVARHRIAVAFAALAITALLATTAFALVQLQAAHQQADRAEAVRQFLVGVFDQASPDENKGQPFTAHQLLEKGEKQLDITADDQAGLNAEIAALLGELYIGVGDFPRALSLIQRASPALADPHVPDGVRARILLSKAWIQNENGEYEKGLAQARESLALLERAPRRSAESIAEAHLTIAYALMGTGDWNGTEQFVSKTLPTDRAAIGDLHDSIAGQWEQLGDAQRQVGRYDEAVSAFNNAIAIYRKLHGENSSHIAHVISPLASVLESKDLALAEQFRRQAVAIHLAQVGPDHHDTLAAEINLLGTIEIAGHYDAVLPQRLALIARAERAGTLHPRDMATQYTSLGKNYRELGRFAEAEEALRHSLDLTRQDRGPDSVDSAPALRHLDVTQMLAGQYADAEATIRSVLAIRGNSDPASSPVLNLLRSDLGNLLRLRHHAAAAVDELRAADQAIASTPETAAHPWRMDILAALSQAELDAGDAAAAERSASQAVAIARRTLRPGHYQLGIALFALARTKLALEKTGEAERLLREALTVRTPPFPADDPRVLEVKVGLINALETLFRKDEARPLRDEIEPLLKASPSPYANDLLARLDVTSA